MSFNFHNCTVHSPFLLLLLFLLLLHVLIHRLVSFRLVSFRPPTPAQTLGNCPGKRTFPIFSSSYSLSAATTTQILPSLPSSYVTCILLFLSPPRGPQVNRGRRTEPNRPTDSPSLNIIPIRPSHAHKIRLLLLLWFFCGAPSATHRSEPDSL